MAPRREHEDERGQWKLTPRPVVLLLVGAIVLTNLSMRRRQITRAWSETVEAADRFVDVGVDLHVVRADPKGKVLIDGARPMVILRTHPLGGIIDTKSDPPRFIEGAEGLSKNPQQWFCSEDQEPIILHGDTAPIGTLALGGMGAGKTTAGVQWLYLRWLESLGSRKEGGVTAPTETRLSLVLNELFRMWPRAWWTYNTETKIVTLCDGFRIRGVSTHRQSASQGSRLQGFNWLFWMGDELQDQCAEFVDIQARLRAKSNGQAKRLATATAKDFPEWRDLKSTMLDSGDWSLHTLLGPRSPFVHPDHWERMKRSTNERDYQRLVMAEDLPPESRVYFSWDRKRNLQPVPHLGMRRVTSIVLSRKTGNKAHSLLVGHDPGTAKAASVWLDAYEINSKDLAARLGAPIGETLWWVRGELFTLHESAEQHARSVLESVRKHGCNIGPTVPEVAHVRAQPVGQAEDKPDLDIYRIWKRVGFDIKAAQYRKDGTGTGQIKKDSRIEMVNRLLCDAAGKRRLFIDVDEHGKPVAPRLVEAFETMERDHKGRAEHEEKNEKDPTDAPCALGYALWPWEKEAAPVAWRKIV